MDSTKIFDVVNSMNSKISFGGTAPKNIKKMITKYKGEIK
jgi:argininosuccinate lyase